MKRKFLVMLWTFTVILMVGIVSASFSFDDDFAWIETDYLDGEIVKGGINMSFSNHRNAEFTSNFEGGIKLLDLLELEHNKTVGDYSCNPVDCEDDFIVDPLYPGSNNVDFNPRNKQFYGFKVVGSLGEGEIVGVSEFEFNFSANAGAECNNQLSIDLYDDGVVEYYNTRYLDEACAPKDYGCFNENTGVIESLTIEYDGSSSFGGPYCEKIANLPAAPAYRIGANVDRKFDIGDLGVVLYSLGVDQQGDFLGSCFIDAPETDGEYDCIALDTSEESFSSREKFDGYVCVFAVQESDYEIRSRQSDDVCGGRKLPTHERVEFLLDYEIYAFPLKYDTIGEETFDKFLYRDINGGSLNDLIESMEGYLEERYGSNCPSPGGCVIPLSFSGSDQQVDLDSAKLKYATTAGSPPADDTIYKLRKSEFSISSNYLIFDVEKMEFVVPSTEGNQDFKLRFDGQSVFSEEVDVEVGFDYSISPRFALVGRSTEFRAVGVGNVTSVWDFGDGDIVNSNNEKAQHIYLNDSEYTVEVTITGTNGQSSTKKFKVVAGNAKISANITLNDYDSRISDIEADIGEFPSWIGSKIEQEIGLDDLKQSLNNKKARFSLATDDDEYIDLANDLIGMVVPLSVSVKEEGSLSMAIGFNNLDASFIGEITQTEISNLENAENNIILWMNDNYESVINFQTVVVQYEFSEENLLTSYDVELNQKIGASEEFAYLVIDYPTADLDFTAQFTAGSVNNGGATYIGFNGANPEDVKFLIVGNSFPSVEALGMYISPVVGSLGILDIDTSLDSPSFNWSRFLLWTSILIILVLGLYIVLQTWYKRHYEAHLFRNPNDLYNLINFVYNSRRAGMKDKEIKRKLLEKIWKREQIIYAFKKIDGKRTGMLEIPFFKFIENRKVKKELQIRNPGAEVDTRFIKRPNL